MKYLMILGLLLSGWAAAGVGEETAPPPARLANGLPIEGAIQETNAEGLVFQTPKGRMMFPWKYLSAGTRYRHERPFLEAQEIARSNALQKAKAAEAAAKAAAATNMTAKAASSNVAAPPAVKDSAAPAKGSASASTNVAALAGAKDIATNVPSKTPAVPAAKKKSKQPL